MSIRNAFSATIGILSVLAATRADCQVPESERSAALRRTGNVGITVLAGTLGSAAGMTGVFVLVDCGVEDLACGIRRAALAGVAGVATSTAAVVATARATRTAYSTPGAFAGALIGTGVGLGLHALINRNSDRNIGDYITLPIFALSQGTLAALGSRLIASR